MTTTDTLLLPTCARRPIDNEALGQLFREARTHNGWLNRPVSEALLRQAVDLAKMGPTSANTLPMRVVFVKSAEAKARLKPALAPLDRTTINSWEDAEFVAAVKATGRKKLMMIALWTEPCLTFPALDAMREGYEVYPVVDAVGGTSVEAHTSALERMVQAGARPLNWVQLICELQRDWNRAETVKPFMEILFDPNVPFVVAEQAALAKSAR